MPDFEAVTTWLGALAELTFPVIIAGYLLFVVNKSVEGLKITVQNLTLETRVGMAVLLNALDAQEEYKKQVELTKAKEILATQEKKR